jgi:DNA-binding CsgD family transcriptional regulator
MKHSGRQTDPPRTSPGSDPAGRRLTAREREIALLVADGLKDVMIAKRLGLSPSTVRTHRLRIQHRLQVNGRDEIAAWVAARRSPAYPEAGLRRGQDDRLT